MACRRWLPPPVSATLWLSAALATTSTAAWARPEAGEAHGASLSDLSLEDLGAVTITSASRRSESLADAAASVFVITNDDIRRAGARSLPEALRLAPNLQVAQGSNGAYSISARGVDSALSNKLLVMIDGRSIYTPLYSGVFWDAQDVLLEDVDRIEVVSGPGGALWGVNAVNGIIDVIMRPASERRGDFLGGEIARGANRLGARHGGATAGGIDYSLYALATNAGHASTASGLDADDAARHVQGGFRADRAEGPDRFALGGDIYDGRLDQPPGAIAARPVTHAGGNLLGRWERQAADGGTLMAQASFDFTRRTSDPVFSDSQDILDLQVQDSPAAFGSHRVALGAEYRFGRDRIRNSAYLAFLPADREQHWASVYAQDEVALRADLRATAGLRIEHNDYTGFEFLPSARLAWTAAPGHFFWASLARAVRAPARLDRDFHVPGQPPYQLDGGPGFESEVADDAEIGYRGQAGANALLSATVFATRYDRLRSLELDPGGASLHLGNELRARTHGIELWATCQPLPSWRLRAAFAWLEQEASVATGSTDTASAATAAGGNPGNWWQLRSSHDLGERVELDLALRGVGAVTATGVPSYRALDLRLGWAAGGGIDLAVGARNLIGGGHAEFGPAATRSLIRPQAYARLDVRL
jgi:iron complex outermembrane receptor protein